MKAVAWLSLAILFAPALAHAGEVLSVKAASANFRASPSDKAKIVYAADQFYPVEVVKRQNGWAQVKDFEGDLAWVTEKALTKQATIVIKNDKANIREEPNAKSDSLFQVERGEVFKIEKRQGASEKGSPGVWLKVVDANGDGGWIRSDMTWGDVEAVAAVDAEPTKTDGDKPKDDKKKAETKGEEKAESKACEYAKASDGGETVKLEKCSCSCKSVEVASDKKAESEKKVDLTEVTKEKPHHDTKAQANDKAKMGDKIDKPKASKPKADKKSDKPAQKK